MLALALVGCTPCNAQVSQFPQVYFNDQGTGGFNLNIRQTANSSGTVLTSLATSSRIGAESLTTNSGDAFYNWIRVCLPQTSSTDNNPDYGYMAASEFYMRIHESSSSTNYATVNTTSTPLGVRTTAGGTTYVTISGANAHYGDNSIVARTGSTQNVSGNTWYQIYLPNNCSQTTGWVNGLYLTIPSAPNYRVVGGRICDDPGSCAFLGNINGAQISFSGGNGTTRSSAGFYQYKLASGVSTTITCTASGYTYSDPPSYGHTASSHNYTRNFVMSNTPPGCTYDLSDNSQSFPASGGSHDFDVDTQTGCDWSVTDDRPWITITGSPGGPGAGTVDYTVASYGGTSTQTGTITVTDGTDTWTHSVTQFGISCAPIITPSSNVSIPAAGGTYQITVQVPGGCPSWNVTGVPAWITSFNPTSGGTGTTTLNYTVPANGSTSPNTGTITIAGQAFDVQQAGATPVTYSLQVYTNSGGAYSLTDTLLRTSYSYAPATAPVKICADGSRVTKLVVTASGGTVNMNDIKFRLTGTTSDAEYYGAFDTTYFTTATTTRSYFKHPRYLDDDTPPIHRDHTLEVFNEDDGTVLVTMPVRICRSPILFVHGIWGAQSSFLDMDDDVKNVVGTNNIATYRIDYSETNARSFAVNSYVLPMGLRGVTMKARKAGFSAANNDVVCHSMGGVLARLHLQSSAYKFNIRSLTTINTPHSGTQAANLLFSPSGVITSSLTQIYGELWAEGMPVDQGRC